MTVGRTRRCSGRIGCCASSTPSSARARKAPAAQCGRAKWSAALGDGGRQALRGDRAQLDGLTAPIQAARTCKDSGPCWLDKLKDPMRLLRARCGYELAGRAVRPFPRWCRLLLTGTGRPGGGHRALEWLIGVPSAAAAAQGGRDKSGRQFAQRAGPHSIHPRNEELRRLQARLAPL